MIKKATVTGRTQNRTALGIVTAYLKMYPKTNLKTLLATFNKQNVCTDAGIAEIFMTKKQIDAEKKAGSEWFLNDNACFVGDGEWLTLGDGEKVAFCKMWSANSLARLQKEAQKFNIYGSVGDVPKGNNLGYVIEYEGEDKKGVPVWVWIALLLALGVGAYFLFGSKKEEAPVEAPKVEVPKPVETPIEQVASVIEERIEKQFNAAEFEKGKTELSDEAKTILLDLVTLMQENSSVKLKVEGHASEEGEASFNQKLSESRAKSVVDFLKEKGIAENRLSYEGFGSQKLKNTSDPTSAENRRTEFVITE